MIKKQSNDKYQVLSEREGRIMTPEELKRQRALELLRSKTDSSLLDKSNYSSELGNDILKVKGGTEHINTRNPIGTDKGVTEHINTKTPMKTMSVNSWQDKINSLRKNKVGQEATEELGDAASKTLKTGARNALKAIPLVGALGTALLGSEDASASEIASKTADNLAQDVVGSIPLVGQLLESEAVGPDVKSLEYKLENGTITPEEMMILREQFGMK